MPSFISEAWAAGGAGAASGGSTAMGGNWTFFIIIIVIGVLFYFMLIRPQQKRQKQHREMVSNLSAGDEVVTSGGVLGCVTQVSEQYVGVEVAKGVEIRVQKNAVGTVLPKGTVKHG
ncbi:MAG: preprotein translocase subunit YajC [Gammaproteobacteria bacterium]|nr:preprotein translocase subunit YajC [Nitrococcus sp.]MDN5865000.1 preprotein translocase subunit YajC [Gammaproteobacteria bacterium]